MVIVPLSKPLNDSPAAPGARECEPLSWAGFAAGGSLVAAGMLLLCGERRAGMVAAASGTALALLDQQEWNALPGYIDQVQGVLSQVQDAVNEVTVKREALRRALAR